LSAAAVEFILFAKFLNISKDKADGIGQRHAYRQTLTDTRSSAE